MGSSHSAHSNAPAILMRRIVAPFLCAIMRCAVTNREAHPRRVAEFRLDCFPPDCPGPGGDALYHRRGPLDRRTGAPIRRAAGGIVCRTGFLPLAGFGSGERRTDGFLRRRHLGPGTRSGDWLVAGEALLGKRDSPPKPLNAPPLRPASV